MFEEIPPRREPEFLNQRGYILFFAIIFAVFLVLSAIMWLRWSGHPQSVNRKILLGNFVLTSLISGVFLLTAKSATPKGNHWRLFGLISATTLVQLILDDFR